MSSTSPGSVPGQPLLTSLTESVPLSAAVLQDLSEEFDEFCAKRHEYGAEQYGALKFAKVDTIEEAIFEVLDLANYARYTYIRLRLLQQSIKELTQNTQPGNLPEGFISLNPNRRS